MRELLDLSPRERERRRLDADRRRAWRESGVYSGLTLAQEMERGARQFADCQLIFQSAQRPAQTTLSMAYRRGIEAAGALHGLGFRAGDCLVVQLPHWLEMLHIQIAAFALGVVLIPVVQIYGPAELGFILRQTGARGVVLPDRWRGKDFSAHLPEAGPLPDLEHIIVVGEEACAVPVLRWHELMAAATPLDALPTIDPDTTALIIYTSGTTADPKGVQHSHHSMGYDLASFAMFDDLKQRQPHLCAFPAGHAAGFLGMMRPFFFGNKLVVLDQFDAAVAVRAIAEHQIVASSGTPVHFSRLLAAGADGGIATLRSYMIGSTSVAPRLIELAAEHGIHAYRSYGGSEHPTVTTNFPETPLPQRANSDGTLLPNCQLRLLDDNGADVSVGEPGELLFQGPELMLGYLEPSLNEDAFDDAGWYRSGDIATLDQEGHLRIVDRKKDIIIRGGEKLSSKDIEDVLYRHTAVLEAAVVGWPDELFGEKVAAVVKLAPGAELALSDIQRHFAAAGLARQKTPEYLILVDDFPRTAAGKIQKPPLRRQVKAMAEAEARNE